MGCTALASPKKDAKLSLSLSQKPQPVWGEKETKKNGPSVSVSIVLQIEIETWNYDTVIFFCLAGWALLTSSERRRNLKTGTVTIILITSLVLQTKIEDEPDKSSVLQKAQTESNRVAARRTHWVAPTRRPLLQGCHSFSRPPSTDTIRFLWHSYKLQKALSPKWSRKMLKDLQLVFDMRIHANPAVQLWQRLHRLFFVGSFVPFKGVFKLNPYTPNAADETAASHVANICLESM